LPGRARDVKPGAGALAYQRSRANKAPFALLLAAAPAQAGRRRGGFDPGAGSKI